MGVYSLAFLEYFPNLERLIEHAVQIDERFDHKAQPDEQKDFIGSAN